MSLFHSGKTNSFPLFLLLIIFLGIICFFFKRYDGWIDILTFGFTLLFFTLAILIQKGRPAKRTISTGVLFSIIVFLIPFLLIGYITNGDVLSRSFVAFIVYGIVAFVIKRFFSPFAFQLLLVLIFPPLAIITITIFIASGFTKGYPMTLFPYLGVIAGWLISRISKKGVVMALALVSIGCCYGLIYEMYPIYLANLNGTRMKVFQPSMSDLPLTDFQGAVTSLKKVDADIVILDCWFIGCIPCTKSFPKLEQIYQKYKNDPTVFIASLHFHADFEPKINSFEYIRKYTFPKLDLDTQSQNKWGVYEFPTILVFDRKRNLRYKGELVAGIPLSENDIDNIIHHLKKEN